MQYSLLYGFSGNSRQNSVNFRLSGRPDIKRQPAKAAAEAPSLYRMPEKVPSIFRNPLRFNAILLKTALVSCRLKSLRFPGNIHRKTVPNPEKHIIVTWSYHKFSQLFACSACQACSFFAIHL
jgi:hypothetical protein